MLINMKQALPGSLGNKGQDAFHSRTSISPFAEFRKIDPSPLGRWLGPTSKMIEERFWRNIGESLWAVRAQRLCGSQREGTVKEAVPRYFNIILCYSHFKCS